MQVQNDVEAAHYVERDGEPELVGEQQLAVQQLLLLVEAGAAQGVDAALAHGYHLRQGEEPGQLAEHEGGCGAGGPPGVYAGRVEAAGSELDAVGTEEPLARHADDGGAGGGIEAVGVEVEGGRHAGRGCQGTGS